jgi:uncharacterized membrane protein YsdA (DUF1294 family)/cold shock CspA family protein
MRYQGRITTWKDDRGFGFIMPSGGGIEVFVHISGFSNRSRRPIGNEIVSYKLKIDARGRLQADEVSFVRENAQQPARITAPVMRAILIAASFLTIVAGFAVAGWLPIAVLVLYVLASLTALAVYAWDKSMARLDGWRIAENTLHVLGLCGGWPGALVARHVFRHKSKKRSFIDSFWTTVILNCGALVWMLSPHGQHILLGLERLVVANLGTG